MYTPLIVTTWPFGVAACAEGWKHLAAGASALDAVEKAANITERDPDVSSVGYGGRPNSDGIVELDAAIMDGATHSAGAVASLTGIRTPISVARRVMEATPHVMLAGDNARRFAQAEGFPIEELLTEESRRRWEGWLGKLSEAEVAHFSDAATQITEGGHRYSEPHGRPRPVSSASVSTVEVPEDHDTIGLCALDMTGNLAAGCTTSGMAWKVPGRVGDSPIIGSGLYVDNQVGAAAATGHGDEMMKACVSYRAVMEMERGATPEEACIAALRYLLRKRPASLNNNYGAGIIAIRRDGLYGAAATLSGFSPPHALWQWAVASPTTFEGNSSPVVLREGPYVTSDAIVPSLINL